MKNGSRSDVKKRRASFYQLAQSLGLPPPISTKGFKDFVEKQNSAVKVTDDNIVKGLAGVSEEAKKLASELPNFILQAATIKSDISNVASTLAGICVDFAESSMLAEDLVADLFETAGTEKESEIYKSAIVVGKAGSKKKMSSTFYEAFNVSWAGEGGPDSDVRKWHYRLPTLNKAGEISHVVADLKASEQRTKSDPEAGAGRVTSPDNCSLHTVFVRGSSGKEHTGSADASLFLNFIPSSYLSQCVPYFDIEIVPNPMYGNTMSVLQTLTPHLALGPSIGSKKGGADIDTTMLASVSEDGQEPWPQRLVGIDTFLTPQTLTRSQANSALEMNHVDPVASDPFKPIATVTSFEVETSMHQKEISTAKGSLSLKFPDRTKIEGLAQLAFGGAHATNIVIKFGWIASPSHDAANQADPMLEYINNQRVKMSFKPAVSSMIFTETGGADVTLDLFEMDLDDQAQMLSGTPVRMDELSTHLRMSDAKDAKYMNFVMTQLSFLDPYENLAIKRAGQVLTTLIDTKSKKSSRKGRQKKTTKKSNSPSPVLYSIKDLQKLQGGKLYKDTDKLLEDFANSTGRTPLLESTLYYLYSVDDTWKADILVAAEAKIKENPKATQRDKDYFSLSDSLPDPIYLTSDDAEDLDITKVKVTHSVFKSYLSKLKRAYTKSVPRKQRKGDPIIAGLSVMQVALREMRNPRLLRNYYHESMKTHSASKFGLPSIPDPKSEGQKTFNDPADAIIAVDCWKGREPDSGGMQYTPEMKKSLKKSPKLARTRAKTVLNHRLRLLKSIRSFPLSNGGIWRLRNGKRGGSPAIADVDNKDVPVDDDKLLNWWLTDPKAIRHHLPLSTIVHTTLGQALFASHLYDEVQIVFYDYHNISGGNVAGSNIGDTPIPWTSVNSQFSRAKGSSISFIRRLLRNINDVNGPIPMGYKLHPKAHVTEGPHKASVIPSDVKIAINYFIDSDSEGKTRRVIRVSFYDDKGTMDGGSMGHVLKSASRDGKIPVPADSVKVAEKKLKKMRKEAFWKALGESGVITQSKKGASIIKKSPQVWRAIKSAFKAAHPFINYGTTAGAIKSAQLTMSANGRETLIRYMDSLPGLNKATGDKPFGAAGGNVEKEVLTAERSPMSLNIDLQMIGCPMLAPGSIFFFDFNTNTDADNFYLIQKVKHTFGPGTYDTVATILRQDGEGILIKDNDVKGAEKLMEHAEAVAEEGA